VAAPPGKPVVRLASLFLLVIATTVALAAPSALAASEKPLRVTFIGDSVPASIEYTPAARMHLTEGFDVDLELVVCRRLASPSCTYDGVTPPSALESVRALGSAIGQILVIDVGYNDSSSAYRSGMEAVIRSAKTQGVKGIIWVDLREARPDYALTNDVIRSVATEWPIVQVADWNSYSAGQPWFSDDGLHLNASGADGLVNLLRPLVLEVAAEVRTSNPPAAPPTPTASWRPHRREQASHVRADSKKHGLDRQAFSFARVPASLGPT
jgi:hypothetical protein